MFAPLLFSILGCDGESTEVDAVRGEAPVLEPTAPVLRRLTREQYAHALRDLFGAGRVYPANLEPDIEVDGLLSLGSAVTTISPYGVEQYETAALQISEQLLADPDWIEANVPCEPSAPRDDGCARAALEPLGARIWRRPLTDAELTALTELAGVAGDTLDDFYEGLEYPLSAMLQSPWFLYRVETGAGGRYTDFEMASRLSFFLWDTIPDPELYAAAAAGELSTEAGLAVQVDRMLDDERLRDGLRARFTDLLGLHHLAGASKDPTVFNAYTPELKQSALEQTLQTLEYVVLDRDQSFRHLFTSRVTFLDRQLAALYGVRAPARDGFAGVELPEEAGRAGLLGHASILMMEAHPVSSSVTKRGVFVRTRLLCQAIPPPPADVDTSIPEPSQDALTMRDRVAVHLEDPTCAGCHSLTDPIGLGLEQYDGIGGFRETENGVAIDPSGVLDGVVFDDAIALGERVAWHPELASCLAERLFAQATGRSPARDDPWVAWHAEGLELEGMRVRWLLRDLVTSEAFRTVGGVE